MPVQTIVGNPESIRSQRQLDSVLSRIIAYEQERNCIGKGGVLWGLNLQLGAYYRIRSEEEAEHFMKNPRACELAVKFYPRSYFEHLKSTLKDEPNEEIYE